MKKNRKKWRNVRAKLLIHIISTVAMFALVGAFTYQATKAKVTIVVDDEAITVATHDDTVEELLEELDIEVAAYDDLSHESTSPLSTGMEIHITRANQVTVEVDDEKTDYHTTAETLEQLFEEEHIEIGGHDVLSHPLSRLIEDGMNVKINRAYPVTIHDGGKETNVWTTGGTVATLLNEEKIVLGEWDEIVPVETEELTPDTVIRVTRVEITTEVVEENQPYTTVTKEDAALKKGVRKVISEGEDGIVESHFEVRKENGEETERKLLKKEVTKEAKQEVVAVGTKAEVTVPADRQAPAAQTSVNGSADQTLYMHATAYTAECKGCSGITATGINLKQNPHLKVIAVDPSVIPLGSKVWVEGYGTAVAGDTGGAIQGSQIDVHMPSRQAALNFGSKKVQVKIID